MVNPCPPRAFEKRIAGRRVLVTGHTGFKGGWLSLWLTALGCDVSGLALSPSTTPNLFDAARVGNHVKSTIGDIRDPKLVRDAVEANRPEVIFHLAAQPLVSRSFGEPLATFATNTLGTSHVLDAATSVPGVLAVVCVTTDKVYVDRGWPWGYRETDTLGGKDPYSASKAAAELVALCYRNSVAARGNECAIATARGGNVIGGGDWSEDRIVTDFYRAVTQGTTLTLRRPDAIRPWQHVLTLAHGYIALADGLIAGDAAAADAWNFGPGEHDAVRVGTLVDRLADQWARPPIECAAPTFPETHYLRIDSAKARNQLGWSPALDFEGAVRLTADWYKSYCDDASAAERITAEQIDVYRRSLDDA